MHSNHFLELDKLELDKLLTGTKIAAVSTSAQRWGPEPTILCGKELIHWPTEGTGKTPN